MVRYECDRILGHVTEEDDGFWLNLDWTGPDTGSHPGGPLYRSEKEDIVYVRERYTKTSVDLPPKYRDRDLVAGSVIGNVVDDNGNPLSCTVVATDEDGGKEYPYSVNNSGTFKLELPPGKYRFTAEKSGYNFRTEEAIVVKNLDASVDLAGVVRRRPNIQFRTEAVIDPAKRCIYYTRDDEGHWVFKIRVYVTGPDIYRIKSVKYSLHETFENPEHVVTDSSKNFEMIIWAWGRFSMPIIVTTSEGNEYEYMYPFTFRSQVEDAQRRGYRLVDATYAWDVIGGY